MNQQLLEVLSKSSFGYDNWTDWIPIAIEWASKQVELPGVEKKRAVMESVLFKVSGLQLPDCVDRETFLSMANHSLGQFIETFLKSDNVIRIEASSAESIEDDVAVEHIIRNVLSMVADKHLTINPSNWMTLTPLVMHAVAVLSSHATPGLRKQRIAIKALKCVIQQLPSLDQDTKHQIIRTIDVIGPSTITALKDAADGVFEFVRKRTWFCCTD